MKLFLKKIILLILLNSGLSVQFFAQTVNPNGYNKFFYENGKLSSEGIMKDGKPDGYWKNYHKNGQVKIEGNRKNFLLDSLWKFYDEKGRLTKTINYREGKKNGPSKVYDTLQKLVIHEEYKMDLKDGFTRTFYKSGKTKTLVPFTKGRQDGIAYEYNQDSVIVGISNYKSGILQSYEKINQRDDSNKKQGIWKEFYENNLVKKEEQYNADSLDGYVKEYDRKGSLTTTKKYNNGKRILKAPEIANVEVYREVFDDGTLKYEGVYSDGLAIGTHYRYKRKKICDSSLLVFDDTNKVYRKKFSCQFGPVPDSAIEYFDGTIIGKGAVDSARNKIGVWTEYHYTGEFKGKGIYKDGNRTGDWTFYYSNGNIEQKGRYDKKGRPQGDWKWYYDTGKIMREEHYLNGNREGEMKDYDEEGKVVLQGNYVENRKEGKWVYETNDYLEYANYVNDLPDSLWKTYYMPGKIKRYEGRFVSGEPVGMHYFYHPNGNRQYVGNYVSGMKDGDWKFYDENDFNYLVITYKNDIEIKWQGEKINYNGGDGLKRYNIKISENKSQTIRK